MSTVNTIVKNALANGAGLVCEAVISFCMLPYIIHRIGDAAYGVWVFAIAVSGYMGILNLGFRPAINKYVAQYQVSGDWQKIRDLLQATLFSYSFCAFLILTICTLLAVNVGVWFNIPERFISIASILVFLAGIQMAIGLISVVFGGVIAGLQRYEINNGIEIVVMLVRTVIILVFLDRSPSLLTIAVAHYLTTIIGYVVTVIFAYRIAPISPIYFFRLPNRDSLMLILRFSVVTLVISSVGRIIMYLDSPLIAAVLTTTAVTYYTIGSRVLKYVRSLIEVLMNVTMPAVSDLQARDEMAKVRELFLWSSKISGFITFSMAIFMVLFGREFFLLWLGSNYEQSYNVMVVLVVASIFYFPQINTTSILYGTAKHNILMYLSIISGLLSLIMAVALGKIIGLVGLAIGLSWPQAIISFAVCPFIVSRLLGITWLHWARHTYGRGGIVVIPLAVFLYIVKSFVVVNSWLLFVAILIGGGVIFILAGWLFGLEIKEKQQLLNFKNELQNKR